LPFAWLLRTTTNILTIAIPAIEIISGSIFFTSFGVVLCFVKNSIPLKSRISQRRFIFFIIPKEPVIVHYSIKVVPTMDWRAYEF
jgi:hypothetical protein